VELTTEGKTDPVFSGFPDRFPVVQWHGDTFSIPPGARHLAFSADCRNQAFSKDSVSGIQFHIETGLKQLEQWTKLYQHELPAVHKTRDEILRDFIPLEQTIATLGKQLLRNFLKQV
jgi:GMP synthase-like glutamine amidotransferase